MQPIGRARVEVDIVDLSVLVQTGLKGIVGVLGITERGDISGEPRLIGSWPEYVKYFGGLISGSNFPLICKRALEAGAKLRIARITHFTDVDDPDTFDGVLATGTLTVDTDVTEWDAKSIGAWGNDLSVVIAASPDGDATKVQVTVSIDGYPSLTEVLSIAAAPTADQIAVFNNTSKYVTLTAVTGSIVAGTVTFTTGADGGSVVTVDYSGSAIGQTGIHRFDGVSDINKIAVPDTAVPELDIALSAYADSRKDLIALVRTSVGVDGDAVVDYREGNGTYTHAAINSWRTIMVTGGLRVSHPTTGVPVEITAMGDVIGAMSVRDNKAYEWFTFGGPKRGLIKNALGVAYNFGSPARQLAFDNIDVHGVNAVIQHPTFGVVIWGNSTLYKNPSMLKHANVAELFIFIQRTLKPLIESEQFDPNDIETWKNIYKRVTPLLDYVKAQRGIWDYLYQGDQDIDDISQAQVNEPQNVDAGMYQFNLFLSPKVGMKYVGVKVAVTNSGVDFEELTESI